MPRNTCGAHYHFSSSGTSSLLSSASASAIGILSPLIKRSCNFQGSMESGNAPGNLFCLFSLSDESSSTGIVDVLDTTKPFFVKRVEKILTLFLLLVLRHI